MDWAVRMAQLTRRRFPAVAVGPMHLRMAQMEKIERSADASRDGHVPHDYLPPRVVPASWEDPKMN
jgi:hypothetical protein